MEFIYTNAPIWQSNIQIQAANGKMLFCINILNLISICYLITYKD